MTEIRGESRITLIEIQNSLSSRFQSSITIKIPIIIYNKDWHLQESRSSPAGQRGRSVLQARVITSDFSGNPEKTQIQPKPPKKHKYNQTPQKNPQIQPKTPKTTHKFNVLMFQVLQAGHPPVLYHQAADVLHCHHSSGHNHQSTMTHMNLRAR